MARAQLSHERTSQLPDCFSYKCPTLTPQLYTLIAEAVESFEYLKYGIAFVLAFIGAKLLAGETRSSIVVLRACLTSELRAAREPC